MAESTAWQGAGLRSRDGIALHTRCWPAPGQARGNVLIVHGLGEHIGRYEQLAAQLNAWGWQVAGYDQRGHGRSGGARGRLAHADDLLVDLALVIDALRAHWPGPLVLLGHSLGGLVAARFVAGQAGAAWPRGVSALVMSSPALDPGMSAWQKLLLAVAGRVAPNLGVGNGLKPAWISRDGQVVQRYTCDALVHDRVSPRLARFIVDAAAVVLQRAPQWHVPTLLLYAGSDRCVAPAGSAAFAAAAPSDMLRVQAFPALYHEIFNEPEQQQVFDALHAWLNDLDAGRLRAAA